MKLPKQKTKIVCTIGPASCTVPVIEEMIRNGMNVARVNFSHGNLEEMRQYIRNIREASENTGRIVGILADLPGAKIRLGILPEEPVQLDKGEKVTLTTRVSSSSPSEIPVEYQQLPESVAVGSTIYINDGFIELRVDAVAGTEVHCTIIVGGPIRSHKGLNLPGAKLLVDPVTPHDLELVEFGLTEGVDMFGISFVERPEDIQKVKEHALRKLGKPLYAVAKIERVEAVKNIDDILNVADAVMIARGDLGVEMPIQDVPIIQKRIISKANFLGRPVITATQMLESMKNNTRPTRAEVSDVANAILDGTDAIMLSEETAIGKYPVETVGMMASIAAVAEGQREAFAAPQEELRWYLKNLSDQGKLTIPDVISRNAVVAAEVLGVRYVLTPTETGSTARRVARFKPPCWVLAFSRFEKTCRSLTLSYGVYPSMLANKEGSWHVPILRFLAANDLAVRDDKLIIAEGRFLNQPGGTDSMEILTVGERME
jgi:pyruvate kinase